VGIRQDDPRSAYPALTPRARAVLTASGAVLLLVLAASLRYKVITYVSGDTKQNGTPWVEWLRSHGFHGVVTIKANYNVTYFYLLWLAAKLPVSTVATVKLVTFLFELVFSATVVLILRGYGFSRLHSAVASVSLLFLPSIVLNGAVWGQCDITYSAFCLLSWWALTTRKPWWAWGFFGVAISFKIQAVFFLPVLIYRLVFTMAGWRRLSRREKLSCLSPLAAVAAFFLGLVPAQLTGGRLPALLGRYFSVNSSFTGNADHMVANAANVWQLVGANPFTLSSGAVVFTVALVIIMTLANLVRTTRSAVQENFMFPFAIVMVIPFFLPNMHERYFFLAEVFAAVFAIVTRRLFFIASAVLLQFTMYISYAPFLFAANQSGPLITLAMMAVINGAILCGAVFLLFRGPAKTPGHASGDEGRRRAARERLPHLRETVWPQLDSSRPRSVRPGSQARFRSTPR